MGQQSAIRTLRQVDPPVQLTASYRMNAIDRALLDEEIRATQQHVVDSLINGLVATWAILDTGSAAIAPGDCLCLASASLGTITKALASTLGTPGFAGIVAGIALLAAAPGSPVRFAACGIVPPSITGLTAGSPGYALVNLATGRLVVSSTQVVGSYQVGIVDSAGFLLLSQQSKLPSSGGGGGSTIAWQYGTGAAPAVVVPASSAPQGAWFHGVSSAGSIALPASPTDGETLDVVDEDGTAVNQGITISGSHNILAPDGTSAGSYVFSTAANGYAAGATLRLIYSATRGLWKVM